MIARGDGYTRPADPREPGADINRRVEVRRLTQPRADADSGARIVTRP